MRLTLDIREQIIRNAVTGTLKKRRASLEKREMALAYAIRDHSLGAHKSAYLALPRDLQETHATVCGNLNGKRFDFRFCTSKSYGGKSEPCPARQPVAIKNKALLKRALKFLDDHAKFEAQQRELRALTKSVVYAASTLNQLKSMWPEGKKFYADIEDGKPKLPVSAAKLNEFMQGVA